MSPQRAGPAQTMSSWRLRRNARSRCRLGPTKMIFNAVVRSMQPADQRRERARTELRARSGEIGLQAGHDHPHDRRCRTRSSAEPRSPARSRAAAAVPPATGSRRSDPAPGVPARSAAVGSMKDSSSTIALRSAPSASWYISGKRSSREPVIRVIRDCAASRDRLHDRLGRGRMAGEPGGMRVARHLRRVRHGAVGNDRGEGRQADIAGHVEQREIAAGGPDPLLELQCVQSIAGAATRVDALAELGGRHQLQQGRGVALDELAEAVNDRRSGNRSRTRVRRSRPGRRHGIPAGPAG